MSQPIKWEEAKLSKKIAKNGKLSVVDEGKDLKSDYVSRMMRKYDKERMKKLNEMSRKIKEAL